jgi:hypothetical protein
MEGGDAFAATCIAFVRAGPGTISFCNFWPEIAPRRWLHTHHCV